MKNLKYLVAIGWVLILLANVIGLFTILPEPLKNSMWKTGIVLILVGLTWSVYYKKRATK